MAEQQVPKEIKYDRGQFEAAYRALVSLTHGLRLIEVKEVKRWVQKLTASDITDPEKRSGIERLLRLLDAADTFREVMRTTGVPRQPIQAEKVDPE